MAIQARDTEEHGWTPVHRGVIYCSPQCGGRCTHAAFVRCEMLAKKLLQQLGDDWTVDIWENLGWYWKLVRGHIVLGQHADWTYHATLGTSSIDYYGEGNSPFEALQAMEARARRALHDLEVLVDEASDAMLQALDGKMKHKS